MIEYLTYFATLDSDQQQAVIDYINSGATPDVTNPPPCKCQGDPPANAYCANIKGVCTWVTAG